MRNAGIDDQGLVGHLSEATAGAWSGAGHTTPYEDPGGYAFIVRYLLSTGGSSSSSSGSTGVKSNPKNRLEVEPFLARDARNDYELPWILRGIMDDPEVQRLFGDELRMLKEGILEWNPTTKALKEIRRRVSFSDWRSSMFWLVASGRRLTHIDPPNCTQQIEPMAGPAALRAHRLKHRHHHKLGRTPSTASLASSSPKMDDEASVGVDARTSGKRKASAGGVMCQDW